MVARAKLDMIPAIMQIAQQLALNGLSSDSGPMPEVLYNLFNRETGQVPMGTGKEPFVEIPLGLRRRMGLSPDQYGLEGGYKRGGYGR